MISVNLKTLVLVAIAISKLVFAVPVPSPSLFPRGGSSSFKFSSGERENVDALYRPRSPGNTQIMPRSSSHLHGVERISTSHEGAGNNASVGHSAPTLDRSLSAPASASNNPTTGAKHFGPTETYKKLSEQQKRDLHNILKQFLLLAQEVSKNVTERGFPTWAAQNMDEDIKSKLFSGQYNLQKQAAEAIVAKVKEDRSSRYGYRVYNGDF